MVKILSGAIECHNLSKTRDVIQCVKLWLEFLLISPNFFMADSSATGISIDYNIYRKWCEHWANSGESWFSLILIIDVLCTYLYRGSAIERLVCELLPSQTWNRDSKHRCTAPRFESDGSITECLHILSGKTVSFQLIRRWNLITSLITIVHAGLFEHVLLKAVFSQSMNK